MYKEMLKKYFARGKNKKLSYVLFIPETGENV